MSATRPWLLPVALAACVSASEDPAQDTDGEPSVVYDDTAASSQVETDVGPVDPRCQSRADADPAQGMTPYLRDQLLGAGELARPDLVGGAFGGRVSEQDCAAREPVVFVHGNGDRAYGGAFGGWARVHAAFQEAGYRSAELYATTYGPGDALLASQYAHDRQSVMQVRGLLEAVLAHTGAARVDVVAHSLGVTMARRAILGGTARDRDGRAYEIGPPLTERIDTFVGIAGGNLGLASCAFTPGVPVCSPELGLYPGWFNGFEIQGVSDVLEAINAQPGREGAHRFSVWSEADEVVGGACLVWGRNTCRVPGQTGERRYQRLDHFELRDRTAAVVLGLVTAHE